MSASEATPEALSKARQHWDRLARANARLAILGDDAMEDPLRAEAAFEEAGESDRRLAVFLHPEARVVDLGSGIGRVMRQLAPWCGEILGVDISEEMITASKDYLSGLDNARVLPTDGRSLKGIESGSVDFLYSLLCLIHVDKRSAFSYFRETERVLRPGSLALLGFYDILSTEGMDQFIAEIDRDDPLELYTKNEVIHKLRRSGLEVLRCIEDGRHLFALAVKGSAESWIRETAASIRPKRVETRGFLHAKDSRSTGAGGLILEVANDLAEPRSFLLDLKLSNDSNGSAAPRFKAEAIVSLPAKQLSRIEVKISEGSRSLGPAAGSGRLTVTVNGAAALVLNEAFAPHAPGATQLRVGLAPPGFGWDPESLRRFPALFHHLPLS